MMLAKVLDLSRYYTGVARLLEGGGGSVDQTVNTTMEGEFRGPAFPS